MNHYVLNFDRLKHLSFAVLFLLCSFPLMGNRTHVDLRSQASMPIGQHR